jgi:hypothetical protein
MRAPAALQAVKLIHTIVWVFFAGCVILLPAAAYRGHFALAFALIGFVLLETLVLLFNRWRCPLTDIAAKHTSDRQANFDIFLPLWLAKYNKEIFGALFIAGLAYTIFAWWLQSSGV